MDTNLGVQFTTFIILRDLSFYYDERCAEIEDIISYLVNLRRLCLTEECARSGFFRPDSAHLTNLILRRIGGFSTLPSYVVPCGSLILHKVWSQRKQTIISKFYVGN